MLFLLGIPVKVEMNLQLKKGPGDKVKPMNILTKLVLDVFERVRFSEQNTRSVLLHYYAPEIM